MTDWPGWLPDMISAEGSATDLLARLRLVWLTDFKTGSLTFQGIPVVWDEGFREGVELENGF